MTLLPGDNHAALPRRAPKRNHRSARQAGARFEREIADALANYVDDRIDRRVKTGAQDKGDIGGVRLHGERVVIECKNESGVAKLGTWYGEAEQERINDTALAGLVVFKRHGVADPLDQWFAGTLRDLIFLLGGDRPE